MTDLPEMKELLEAFYNDHSIPDDAGDAIATKIYAPLVDCIKNKDACIRLLTEALIRNSESENLALRVTSFISLARHKGIIND